MEYKWEAVKEDAEVGFQIESSSLIGCNQCEHQFENPFEPLLKRMKKNVNIIKRACLFVQQQKNIKSLQSYCSSQVKSVLHSHWPNTTF